MTWPSCARCPSAGPNDPIESRLIAWLIGWRVRLPTDRGPKKDPKHLAPGLESVAVVVERFQERCSHNLDQVFTPARHLSHRSVEAGLVLIPMKADTYSDR